MTAFPFHPIADMFPLIEGAEFDALVADIKANALRFKIVLHEGMILDGRNRYRAMLAAGHTPIKGHFQEYKPALPSDTPLSYVITANLHRRHLTAADKRKLIVDLIKAQPQKSDRQIAEMLKVSPTYVGKVRAEAEKAGDVSTVDTRTDTRGRKQPARKRSNPGGRSAAVTTRDPEPAKKARTRKRPIEVVSAGKTQEEVHREIAHQLPLRELWGERDDVGETSAGEHARLETRIAELASDKRRLELKCTGLESEVDELKAENMALRKQLEAAPRIADTTAASDPGPIPACLVRAARDGS